MKKKVIHREKLQEEAIGAEGVTSDTMSDIKVKNKNRLKFIGECATRNDVYTKD